MYNEQKNLPILFDAIYKALASLSQTWEVVLVDDGSEDGSLVVLTEFANKELYEKVHEAIAKLPDKYRVIITLKGIDNLTYQEIAEIMKISVNKVKVWLFRARMRIYKMVEF